MHFSSHSQNGTELLFYIIIYWKWVPDAGIYRTLHGYLLLPLVSILYEIAMS